MLLSTVPSLAWKVKLSAAAEICVGRVSQVRNRAAQNAVGGIASPTLKVSGSLSTSLAVKRDGFGGVAVGGNGLIIGDRRIVGRKYLHRRNRCRRCWRCHR